MVRINSVISTAFGKEVGLLEYLYSYLMAKNKINLYNSIIVNHIGLDLEEKIFYDPKRAHINIRWPLEEDLKDYSLVDKNNIYLQLVHAALMRLADEDSRISPEILAMIRDEIVSKNFLFEIDYLVVPHPGNKLLIGKILLRPFMDKFEFFVQIVIGGELQWEAFIYAGGTSSYYFDDILLKGKWKGDQEFIVEGRRSEIEFHMNAFDRTIVLHNKTGIKDNAPIFNLFRLGAGHKEFDDYLHSLPPAVAAIISVQLN